MAASMNNVTKSKRKIVNFSKSAKIVTSTEIFTIKSIAKDVVKSKKYCNRIVDIFEAVEVDPAEEVILACIRALHKIFCHYLDANEIQVLKLEQDNTDHSQVKIRQWLRERYAQAVDKLLGWIAHPSRTVQELSLCTSMKFVEAESKNPLDLDISSAKPPVLFQRVVCSLLESDENMTDLISRFQEYLEYDDIRFHYMRQAQVTVKKQTVDSRLAELHGREEDPAANNLYSGLVVLSLPEDNSGKLANFLLPENNISSTVKSIRAQREIYSKLWLSYVKLKLPGYLYKKLLVSLPDKVLPHLCDPLVMADWFISLYNLGGAVGLMSLNGLFVLMNKYNLEYPDFYTKLYAIMGNEVFNAKYKARFFHLLDVFLQSLLLPMYTVAAFVKKLSRMALTAPPHGSLLIIELVINLLIRHDTCKPLVHRDTPCDIKSDPYLPEERNLQLCKASESSLWEIKTLQKHWFHRLAAQAQRIENPLPKSESSLDDLLELDMEQLVATEMKKSKKMKAREERGEVDLVPISHIPPRRLLEWENSKLSELWSVLDANSQLENSSM